MLYKTYFLDNRLSLTTQLPPVSSRTIFNFFRIFRVLFYSLCKAFELKLNNFFQLFTETLVLVDGNEYLNFLLVTTAYVWVRILLNPNENTICLSLQYH